MYDQALQPGIVAVPNLWIFNTKKVKQWPMPQAAAHSLDAYWNLELQAGQ
jgi:hypothetical protein